MGFSVIYRNPGHWDFVQAGDRAFRIRGGAGLVLVMDERDDPSRPFPRKSIEFRSVSAATLYCAEELMQEGKP